MKMKERKDIGGREIKRARELYDITNMHEERGEAGYFASFRKALDYIRGFPQDAKLSVVTLAALSSFVLIGAVTLWPVMKTRSRASELERLPVITYTVKEDERGSLLIRSFLPNNHYDELDLRRQFEKDNGIDINDIKPHRPYNFRGSNTTRISD